MKHTTLAAAVAEAMHLGADADVRVDPIGNSFVVSRAERDEVGELAATIRWTARIEVSRSAAPKGPDSDDSPQDFQPTQPFEFVEAVETQQRASQLGLELARIARLRLASPPRGSSGHSDNLIAAARSILSDQVFGIPDAHILHMWGLHPDYPREPLIDFTVKTANGLLRVILNLESGAVTWSLS